MSHYYHIYLLDAADKDEAECNVNDFLEGYTNQEFDYYNIIKITKITQKNKDIKWRKISRAIKESKLRLIEFNKTLLHDMASKNINSFSEIDMTKREHYQIGYYIKNIGKMVCESMCIDKPFMDLKEYDNFIDHNEYEARVKCGRAYFAEVDLHS